ncbi:MAG TPA: PP2C family protein-serine/threonine phosphatase [Thermoanaerobaculia bacterium]|jgi:sigma-B regulation protein RsbU (phosphoserine phosphatase)
MTSPASLVQGVRLEELWKKIAGILASDESLPARIAEAAVLATGAQEAALYLRERDAWTRSGPKLAGAVEAGEIPDPLPGSAFVREGDLWVPLETEGELHGLLRLLGVPGEPLESGALLAFLFGSLVGAHRLARMVRDAEFELKARLLELESLYDLGLSLGGQLDLSSLADEVLFRSISLTDAGRGTLVLMEDSGAVLLERSVGAEILAGRDAAAWKLPEGGFIHNATGAVDMGGASLPCDKMLAVEISVSGRRLGVLAVADKESRDSRVLDFTPTDARLLSLFANQAAAAIETARLHKEALEKERIERELELAATIQRQILPRDLPSVPGISIAARNVPTRQVGGDYFDVFPLSGGRLAFLVADVSGKGIPAALLVSTVHAAVHLQIDEARTISDLVQRIDRHLQRYAVTRKFLTAFFGLLEPETGVLRYVSAGHNPALLRRAGGGIEQLGATGVPLGMFPNAAWREETRPMAKGDLLCVYSDGITEALDASDEEFGVPRLSRLLDAGSPEEICRRVFDEVASFAADVPQYDDQTLLLLRRT